VYGRVVSVCSHGKRRYMKVPRGDTEGLHDASRTSVRSHQRAIVCLSLAVAGGWLVITI
jgi:hypothetical protein